MKKIAIYARYSSDNQREESIEAQIRAINEFCEKNNYKVIKIYTDEAKSATSDNRPEFQQMIKDSNTGIFDIVVVHKLDRFSRDRYDSAFYKRELKKNNVQLVSVLENLDDSPESIILESVLEGMAEYYSANLSREVMKGMKETAYQCKHTGGIPPLGYNVDKDKNYIINDLEADIVKAIFEMCYKGNSYSEILDYLKSNGLKTKLGKDFSRSSLNNILRNEKYCGTYVFNKTGQKIRGKRNIYNKSEEEIIRIENGIPAIVSTDIFNAIQKKMDTSSQSDKAAKKSIETYMLSGKIFCGECGSRMKGNKRFSGRNKNKYVTYDCSNRRDKKGCTAKSINRDLVEGMIIEFLEEDFFSYSNIDNLADKLIESNKKINYGVPQTINAHTYKLKQIQKKIDNIIDAISNGMFHISMKEKMDNLEKEKASYESKIANLKLKLKNNKNIDKQKIIDFLEQNKSLKKKSLDMQKHIVQTFIKKVTVYEDHIIVETIVPPVDGGEPITTVDTIHLDCFYRHNYN